MAIYYRDGFKCVYCGAKLIVPMPAFRQSLKRWAPQLDHIKPRKASGRNAPSNLVTSCARCNGRKQHRELSDACMHRIARQVKKPINRVLGRDLARTYGYKL